MVGGITGIGQHRLPECRFCLEVPSLCGQGLAKGIVVVGVVLIELYRLPDDVWQPAEAAFTPEGLAQLVFAITAINAWNRLMTTARVEPGHYEPGLFEAA